MTRARPLRLYDLKLFLGKENKSYCLSNRIRYTICQISLFSWLKDTLNLYPNELAAVCLNERHQYHWGGQTSFDQKNAVAWFTWLLAGENASTANLSILLEYLIQEAGQAGMRRCAVTLEEGNWVTSAFRQLGFGVFARQTVWHKRQSSKIESVSEKTDPGIIWQPVNITPFDEFDNFYESQITQSIRQLGSNWGKSSVFAVKKDHAILATAKVSANNSDRIYIEPIFHPGVEDPAGLIQLLADHVIKSTEKNIYVLIPGFQAWLSEAFAQKEYAPVDRQIIFVKNLAIDTAEEARKLPIEQQLLQPVGTGQYTITKKAE